MKRLWWAKQTNKWRQSRHSGVGSRRSSRSSLTTIIAKQRAKTEAAVVSLKFAKEEAELKKARAEMRLRQDALSADLELLQKQREAETAAVELGVMEEELESASQTASEFETKSRVRHFIEDQNMLISQGTFPAMRATISHDHPRNEPYAQRPCANGEQQDSETVQSPFKGKVDNHIPTNLSPHVVENANAATTVTLPNLYQDFVPQKDPPTPTCLPPPMSAAVKTPTVLSASAPIFAPRNLCYTSTNSHHLQDTVLPSNVPGNTNSNQPPKAQPPVPVTDKTLNPVTSNDRCSDFAKFLLRKDLVFARLSKFDDRPENYLAWKRSFQSVMEDLGINSSEELDLLVKYLGPQSHEHAVSVRASNAYDHSKGVERIWRRLDERYGSPEAIEAAFKRKLESFPRLTAKDKEKLYVLSDIVTEIESVMEAPKFRELLSYFNTSSGVIPIVSKLPPHLQAKWTNRAAKYKRTHDVPFPPFHEFCEFIRELSSILNDPGFSYSPQYSEKRKDAGDHPPKKTAVYTRKTDAKDADSPTTNSKCPIHNMNHSLNQCRGFRKWSMTERKQFLRDHNICFKCCVSDSHVSKDCKVTVKCSICGSHKHSNALHPESQLETELQSSQSTKTQGGEKVQPLCTEVCGKGFSGRSCGKLLLTRVYRADSPQKSIKLYALLDDQSNRTLARSDLFDMMQIPESDSLQYTLSTCSGRSCTSGRKASGWIVESLDGTFSTTLPTVIECNQIPTDRQEIPTPDVTRHYEHLRDVNLPAADDDASILLLIGRDLPEVHHILDQRTGPRSTPFAQKLHLGWVVIGNVCLGKTHPPSVYANVNRTVLENGRPTIFESCERKLTLDEKQSGEDIGHGVFVRSQNDEMIGYSVEDKMFLDTMDREFSKTSDRHWIGPLPFRSPRPRLPNNRNDALKRALILQKSLLKDSEKCNHFTTFMKRLMDNGHAEIAPPLAHDEECWYLPLFGVYHPHKRDQVRVVFDSSAKHHGVSLNNVLIPGPDLLNNLVGVLLRFRREPVAVIADIQQMFYGFRVAEKHRNYLRFLWHRDNDPNKELVEHRMCVHVFGNAPSPAVATYGLRRCVENQENDCGAAVREFVKRNFYVDDGLGSFSTSSECVEVLKKTQETLAREGNLRLHKIASNDESVMANFSPEDLASGLKTLDLSADDLPFHRSLGLLWDLGSDTFTFKISEDEKPCTRRGVLSSVNSLFDPLGLISPVVIQGRILMRDLVAETTDWDLPLSSHCEQKWREWKSSLKPLEGLRIPRCFLQTSFKECKDRQLHVFSDASEKAIATVAFLKGIDQHGNICVGFVYGKSKVAPKHGHTIPRLELCASVLAVEVAEMLSQQLDIPLETVQYYSDSRVVLGYLHNTNRRFYVYVCNRVARILKSSSPSQWHHVISEENPADLGTRSCEASQLHESLWLKGPSFLYREQIEAVEDTFPLMDSNSDKEIRPDVETSRTLVKGSAHLGSSRFKRFSKWKTLVSAITILLKLAERMRSKNNKDGCDNIKTLKKAENIIFREVQEEAYEKEICALQETRSLPSNSSLLTLSPYLDEDGILRVGGRLKASALPVGEKHPILLPGKHHVASILVKHFHEQAEHQGRHITEGAVRKAGFWITGGKRLISSIIFHCVTCRRLRANFSEQKMADLPCDRLSPAPPFTYVGVDVFGPWNVVTRRTRGGCANSKRWAVLFTCLYCRAVHIELLEEMSTSSFINSLRRFYAIRGEVKEFRSDRGTNFVGSTDALQISAINVEDNHVDNFFKDRRTIWKFNPPHSSHMGGVWERLIGVARRILDNMLSNNSTQGQLTHEVLSTLMAEVSAIINSRPIVPVSTDPESPFILSPSVLLTQKTGSVGSCQQLSVKDMYRSQWKYVQLLADTFWKRWKNEFLSNLQHRQKWQSVVPNLQIGDVVLLRDRDVARNQWPLGVIVRVFPSGDDLVRKIEVRVMKDGKSHMYVRPVTEVVKLFSV